MKYIELFVWVLGFPISAYIFTRVINRVSPRPEEPSRLRLLLEFFATLALFVSWIVGAYLIFSNYE